MKRLRLILGASLLAAPWAFSQSPVPAAEEILKFSLEETREQIVSVLGQPAQIADASPDYFTWYYQIGVSDNHEHSHLLLFSKKDAELISVTRNFEQAAKLDGAFPEKETQTYFWPSAAERTWSVRVREMPGDRLAIAMGVSKPSDLSTQLLMIRRSAVKTFLQWLAEQLASKQVR